MASGEIMIDELKRRTAKTPDCSRSIPPPAGTLAAAEVAWIARIVWARQ
jgi:hypothetical protein